MGRLCERKGIYDLLPVVKILKDSVPGVTLQCCGSGETEKVLREVEARHLEDNVILRGWVEDSEKEMLLKKSGIFVLPSYNEGLPVALLEAMAHGLPVVSTHVGGIPDAVENGEEGYLLEPGNQDQLIDSLLKLLRDDNLRQNMGQKAYSRAEKCFDVNLVVGELESLYRRLGATMKIQVVERP